MRSSKDSHLIFTPTPTGLQSWHLPQSDNEINLALRRVDEKKSESPPIGLPDRYAVIRNKDQLDVIDKTDERILRRIEIRGEAFVTAVSGAGKIVDVREMPSHKGVFTGT
jgi:hypothetical protein